MTLDSELDSLDWAILDELQKDGRLSFSALARLVHLSAPAVAERVRKLEQAGVITGYGAKVSAERAGQPLTAFVQLRCRADRCLLRTTRSDEYPEVVEIHKLSGQYCTMLKVRAASLAHFEGLIEQLGDHGELQTHIVMSTQYDERPVGPVPDRRVVHESEGWRGGR